MAFYPIETDYKPNFGLGAYYQGINAANAKQLSEEDILKAFLANQKEQNEQPLDLMVKQWQAAHTQDQMNDPEYRKSMLEGYKGLMNSQIATGKKAMGTVESEIPMINQDNKNKLFMGKTLEDWNKIRMSNPGEPVSMEQIPSGQAEQSISQRPASQWGGEGLRGVRTLLESGKIGDFTKDGKPLTSPKGALFKNQVMPSTASNPGYGITPAQSQTPEEYNRVGDEYLTKLFEQFRDPIKALAAYNAGPGLVQRLVNTYGDNWKDHLPQETKNYISKASTLLQNQQTSDSLLTRFNQPTKQQQLQNILVNDPEQLKKLAQLQAMGENQANVADIRADALVEAALARVQKHGEKLDETLSRAHRIVAGEIEGNKVAAKILIDNVMKSKLGSQAAAYMSNNMNLPATQQTGEVQNFPSPVKQAGGITTRGHVPSVVPQTSIGVTSSGTKYKIEPN